MKTSILAVEKVTMNFGSFAALHNVSVEFSDDKMLEGGLRIGYRTDNQPRSDASETRTETSLEIGALF